MICRCRGTIAQVCRLLLAQVLLAFVPLSAMAQSPGQGFQLFQMLLEQHRINTQTDLFKAMKGDPTRKVIVVIGNIRNVRAWSIGNLRSFVQSGGAVLVATDRSLTMPGVFHIQGGPVRVRNAADQYQGFDDCPIVTRFAPRHRLSRGIRQVIANKSGFILQQMPVRGGEWGAVAHFPRGSRTARRSASGPILSTLSMRNNRASKLIVLADHSILLNSMLTHGDNALLAMNIADYLVDLNREELYFVVDGQAVSPKLPYQEPPIRPEEVDPLTLEDLANLPPGQLLEFSNALIADLEDANIHNELLAEQPADIESGLYRRILFLALAVVAALFIIRQIPKGSKYIEAPIRRQAKSVSETRVSELMYTGNLLPAARELAREFFRTLTESNDVNDWQFRVDEVQIDGGLVLRRSVRKDLAKLQALASRADRSFIPKREFQKLAKRIEYLYRLHRSGGIIHPWFVNH